MTRSAMTRNVALPLALSLAVLPGLALSQDDATAIGTAESEAHGTYLTDGEGRAVYLFTADTRGTADQAPRIACDEACLENWPLVTTGAEPRAEGGAQADLLGTTEHEGETVVTYNGWPLYYFVRDEGPGETAGQEIESYGGEWYLVTPEGSELEGEGDTG